SFHPRAKYRGRRATLCHPRAKYRGRRAILYHPRAKYRGRRAISCHPRAKSAGRRAISCQSRAKLIHERLNSQARRRTTKAPRHSGELFFNHYSVFLRRRVIFAARSSNSVYTTGISNNVKILEIVRPNIIVTASGCCISAPSPNARPSGTIARIVVSVVIKIGRKRLGPASSIASYRSLPFSLTILI